jgi:hypothetical protein
VYGDGEMENAFAGEKDVLQKSLESGQYIDDGDGFPSSEQARKRIRNARGCLSAASLDQWRFDG